MQRYLPLILVVGLLIAFRALGSAFPETLPNFQPLSAVFFCGAILAPGWRGFVIPFGVWAITYPLGIGHVSDVSMFASTLIAFTAVFFLGQPLTRKGIPTLLLGSVAAALVFHLITNTAAWIGSPLYAKTLTGFWQSQWTGSPASPLPSWVFLRNLAAANVVFTGIFALAQIRSPKMSVSVPLLAKSR